MGQQNSNQSRGPLAPVNGNQFASLYDKKHGTQQDTWVHFTLSGVDVYGVFDGHLGDLCSSFLRDNFQGHLADSLDQAATLGVGETLYRAIMRLDENFVAHYRAKAPVPAHSSSGSRPRGTDVGSSACVLAFTKDRSRYFVANTGDSRAAAVRLKSADSTQLELVFLNQPHKPDDPAEHSRITGIHGGFVEKKKRGNVSGLGNSPVGHAQGVLATSRCIGMHNLRPFVIPEPDVVEFSVTPLDVCYLVASAGLWEILDEAQVIRIMERHLSRSSPAVPGGEIDDGLAYALADTALRARTSFDNVTVMVVCPRETPNRRDAISE